ncbi:MAG: hypothetical protein GY771_12135 [bacterium]|nr:hypothetical protein [bacterium]
MDEHTPNRIAADLARQLVQRGGKLPITVDSPSMAPCAAESDVYNFVAGDDIVVGDIVLVEGDKRAITHRIVKTVDDSFLLKGDIRPGFDGFFARDDIVAICDKISHGELTYHIKRGKEKRLAKAAAFVSLQHGRLYRLTGSARNFISKLAFLPFHYWHWFLLNFIYRRR